jgi:hypothetical protein
MKYSFQMMVSGTVDTGEEDTTGAGASSKVAAVMQHIPSLMGGDTGLMFDTMTSGIKAVPDLQQFNGAISGSARL